MHTSTELNSIEVKEGCKNHYLFGLLCFAIVIAACFIIPSEREATIDFFFGRWSFAKLPAMLTLSWFMGLSLYYYFDARVKLRVDKNGIWTRRFKEVPWDDIWCFSSTVSHIHYGDLYYLKLRLKDREDRLDKELKIRYRMMDKEFRDVREVIVYYAAKYGIQDLGHQREK